MVAPKNCSWPKEYLNVNRLRELEAAIDACDGFTFQRLARHLLMRERYPELNPLPEVKDMGQDARVEPALLARGQQRVSLAVSKDASRRKVLQDCQKVRDSGTAIDVVVFCTCKPVTQKVRKQWERDVLEQFGWVLSVYDRTWLFTVIVKPEYEAIVDDYLGVPPPGGDFLSEIQLKFRLETEHHLRYADTIVQLPFLKRRLERTEVGNVIASLTSDRGVIIVGPAGSGKSGIAVLVARTYGRTGFVLFLDARQLSHLQTSSDLDAVLKLHGSFRDAVRRLGQKHGCLVIVDQLENLGASPAAKVVTDALLDIVGLTGIQVIAVCREWDLKERRDLAALEKSGRFIRVKSEPIPLSTVKSLLEGIGLTWLGDELLELAGNPLNLSLVVELHYTAPSVDFTRPIDQTRLWDLYREKIVEREGTDEAEGKAVLAAAVRLAREALAKGERSFPLGLPPSKEEERLVSCGLLTPSEGARYRFRHEQIHDYFYSWDAAERRRLMPREIVGEIGEAGARSLFPWIIRLYEKKMPAAAEQFLREVLGV